jgi:hypothetical protein
MLPKCATRGGISGAAFLPRKTARAISTARGPLNRSTAIAASPNAVLMAAIVSFMAAPYRACGAFEKARMTNVRCRHTHPLEDRCGRDFPAQRMKSRHYSKT